MITMTAQEPRRCIRRIPRIASGPIVNVIFITVIASTLLSVDAISRASTSVLHGTFRNSESGNRSGDRSGDESNSIGKTCGKRRGKMLEEQFDELDLLQAYEEIKSEYHEKAFGGSAFPDIGGLPAGDLKHWKLLATMNPNKKNKKHRETSEKDDEEIIRVFMLEHPSDPLCPYVKMETVIPMPVEKCWDFLSLDRWDETMPKMDPFYEGLDIYGEYSVSGANSSNGNTTASELVDEEANGVSGIGVDVNVVKMILARKRTKRILAFGKREFVFVSVEDTPLKDGTWVSGTVSVEVPEPNEVHDEREMRTSSGDASPKALPLLRRNKSYTRAFQDSIAFYKPLPATSTSGAIDYRTRLTIVCRIDLNDSSGEHGSGGCIPMWLYVKTIGITGARSVLNMRRCLLEADEREGA
mmetsp:Transcript_17154/g.39621  ORF Transcript_17154/g.39621 Transcript_17154/m.39621 type:complete len:412 (+) Transcript_17154:122-1357(+)